MIIKTIVNLCFAQPSPLSPLDYSKSPPPSPASSTSSIPPTSYPSHFHQLPPPHADHILLSLKHFENLKKSANHHLEKAQWSNIQIELDLAQARTHHQVHIDIKAQLSGSNQAWVYLTPQMQTPLQVWLDQSALHPQVKGSYLALPLHKHRKLKLKYTLPLTLQPQKGSSVLIPLPPIPHAQVSVVNAPIGWHLSPSIEKGSSQGNLSLKGALFLTLPPQEKEPFLQKQEMKLHIHAPSSELEQGAHLMTEFEVNVPHPPSWIRVAPLQDALLKATLDGQNAATIPNHFANR